MLGLLYYQPPSGGCVLKQILGYGCRVVAAAAFRRLCVETLPVICRISRLRTAAFRRLCVETDTLCLELGCCIQPPSGGCVLKQIVWRIAKFGIAAAFRRLCVETLCMVGGSSFRQPAAFRRLCVETVVTSVGMALLSSRLQAAVC